MVYASRNWTTPFGTIVFHDFRGRVEVEKFAQTSPWESFEVLITNLTFFFEISDDYSRLRRVRVTKALSMVTRTYRYLP